MYIRFLINIRHSCQMLMKCQFSQQIFKIYSNIKFHENPSSGSRVVACINRDGQTGMTKPIAAFHNFAELLKKKK